MMGHKICLFGEIWKIISKLYLLLLLIWSSDIKKYRNGVVVVVVVFPFS